MRIGSIIAFGMAAVFFLATSAQAGVVSLTGQVDFLPTPALFDQDHSALNNGRGEIFQEVVGHTVPDTYPGSSGSPPQFQLDITSPGTFPGDVPLKQTIQPGWVLSSYVFHWVPSDRTSIEKPLSGSITFERPIAGLQVEQQSTPFFYDGFQLPGIDLSAANYLELCFSGEGCDSLSLSQDMRTVSFTLAATTGTDTFRIFFLDSVSSVAEPDAASLLLIAFAGLAARRQRAANG